MHPRIRIPLWAAVLVALAAFAWRIAFGGLGSLGRSDALVAGLFLILLVAVWVIRRWVASGDAAEEQSETRHEPGSRDSDDAE